MVFPSGGFHCPFGSLCLLCLRETMTTIFVPVSSPLDASGSICSIFTNEVNFPCLLFFIIRGSTLMWVHFFKVKENKNGKGGVWLDKLWNTFSTLLSLSWFSLACDRFIYLTCQQMLVAVCGEGAIPGKQSKTYPPPWPPPLCRCRAVGWKPPPLF